MGELTCLKVGCGDASIITSGNHTFLIDCHQISEYSSKLPASKNIRGVFITHQHSDHYSGLKYLWDNKFTIDFILYSPYSRRNNDNSVTLDEWNEFNDLIKKFKSRGTETRTPYRQSKWENPYWSAEKNVDFWIIGPEENIANSATREIHDACLVVKAHLGKRQCLFTGDASDKNLEYIKNNSTNYCKDILHASHHGSINGAHLEFIKGCEAKYTVISTKSGVHSNVPHPTALKRYDNHTEKKVYRTDKFGSVKWEF